MSEIFEGSVRISANSKGKKRLLPICICIEDSELIRKKEIKYNIKKIHTEICNICRNETNMDIKLRFSAFSEKDVVTLSKFSSVEDIDIDRLMNNVESLLNFEGSKNVRLFDCIRNEFTNIARQKQKSDNSYKPIIFLIGSGGSDKGIKEMPERIISDLYAGRAILLIKPISDDKSELKVYNALSNLNSNNTMFKADESLDDCIEKFAVSVEMMSRSTAANYDAIENNDPNKSGEWKELT